ncbi:GAF domain-containing protein [Flavisolibacter sp. BT320]|jgi:GAF domain-containing protein|nr:GAF domain-containing protein [Flavisolibacter longurius]
MLYTDEQKRLEALREFEIMDSPPEEEYDNITSLASRICGTPISLITLLDEQRQWFKSVAGLEVKETPIEYAFCSYAIQNPSEIMVVPDSRKDERFANNPFVTGEPHIVFYAGMPLVTETGQALGTLCVLDVQEHTLTPIQLTALKQLAKQVVSLMTLRKENRVLKNTVSDLSQQNSVLKEEVQKLKSGTSD